MIMFSWVLFIIQLASSFMMIGIAWLIQMINYPLFTYVPLDSFKSYHEFHQNKISQVTGPLMLIELISGAFLLLWPIAQVPYWLYAINFALILFVWLETYLLQLPLHSKLQQEHSLHAIERIIRLNWLRTITWTLHGAVLIAILY